MFVNLIRLHLLYKLSATDCRINPTFYKHLLGIRKRSWIFARWNFPLWYGSKYFDASTILSSLTFASYAVQIVSELLFSNASCLSLLLLLLNPVVACGLGCSCSVLHAAMKNSLFYLVRFDCDPYFTNLEIIACFLHQGDTHARTYNELDIQNRFCCAPLRIFEVRHAKRHLLKSANYQNY